MGIESFYRLLHFFAPNFGQGAPHAQSGPVVQNPVNPAIDPSLSTRLEGIVQSRTTHSDFSTPRSQNNARVLAAFASVASSAAESIITGAVSSHLGPRAARYLGSRFARFASATSARFGQNTFSRIAMNAALRSKPVVSSAVSEISRGLISGLVFSLANNVATGINRHLRFNNGSRFSDRLSDNLYHFVGPLSDTNISFAENTLNLSQRAAEYVFRHLPEQVKVGLDRTLQASEELGEATYEMLHDGMLFDTDLTQDELEIYRASLFDPLNQYIIGFAELTNLDGVEGDD